VQAPRERRVAQPYGQADELVFGTQTGGPISERNLAQRYFQPITQKAKLPEDFTLYGIRHTAATLLAASGVSPKVAQERLGHASANLTLDVYGHVLDGQQEEATARVDALLSGRS
jgi:integrase